MHSYKKKKGKRYLGHNTLLRGKEYLRMSFVMMNDQLNVEVCKFT